MYGIERDVVSFVGCPSMPINYDTLEMGPSGRIFAAQSSRVDRSYGPVECHVINLLSIIWQRLNWMLYTSSSSFVHVDLSVLRCRKSPHARCCCCAMAIWCYCYWCSAAACSRSWQPLRLLSHADVWTYPVDINFGVGGHRGMCHLSPIIFISAPIIRRLMATICLLGVEYFLNAPECAKIHRFRIIVLILGRGLRSLPVPHPQIRFFIWNFRSITGATSLGSLGGLVEMATPSAPTPPALCLYPVTQWRRYFSPSLHVRVWMRLSQRRRILLRWDGSSHDTFSSVWITFLFSSLPRQFLPDRLILFSHQWIFPYLRRFLLSSVTITHEKS